MKYSAVFLNVFLKQFKKIPSDMQERIKQRILPDALIQEMRDAFMRSEEFLDLEIGNRKKAESVTSSETESNDLMKDAIQKATPEDLGKMQEMLQTWASSIFSKKQN